MKRVVTAGAALTTVALAIITLAQPAFAAPRHNRNVCVRAYIEGAGTVRICVPVRGR